MAYNMRDDIKEVYFTEEQLHEKVAELGARITEDYRDKNPLIVSVLKGSYVFMADLTRAIDTPCNVDFMVVSSYGKGTKTSGEVQIIKDIAQPIDGRDLLIVEDILDTGITLSKLVPVLKMRNPGSVKICTVPVGYADGLNRGLSGCTDFIVDGTRVRQVGNICMDQCMFEVDLRTYGTRRRLDPQIGDEVVIVGRQGDSVVTLDDMANKLGTIHYELACAFGMRLPKVYV